MFQSLRSFLRLSDWPREISIGVLSAKYGLIGGLTPISMYDQRMNAVRAAQHRVQATSTLAEWAKEHTKVSLILGKDYLPALNFEALEALGVNVDLVPGGIGAKRQILGNLLKESAHPRLISAPKSSPQRPLYFLPDWDDLLDPDFDFSSDEFSASTRSLRSDRHCCGVMLPERICDGILVSLAQHFAGKGPLKKFEPTALGSLSPYPLRERFELSQEQILFGDCGAFSYVADSSPVISVEQAVALYDLHGFDFGASVDHIPAQKVRTKTGTVELSARERYRRVQVTRENAAAFITEWRKQRAQFVPVGTIQGISPRAYASQLKDYCDMGYRHVALGGLVPRTDSEILEIARLVQKQAARLEERPWIHLFGVYRPGIQPALRGLGISSFDSATYFRKAWLRSDQNYLSVSGDWYAAIRVPMTSDARTFKRLQVSGQSLEHLLEMENRALRSLHQYDAGQMSMSAALNAVMEYDRQLSRSETTDKDMEPFYARTLADKPWQQCGCPVCSALGIDVVIFRGSNRNKRRGSHNTLMLYRTLKADKRK